jgi:hypothetical protein
VQFLGAVRTIKQDLSSYGVQCIFAVGPFSILFMHGESGSPFNVREAVPVHFFTQEQVSELMGQFSTATGIMLEAGVTADVHELTAGHAGLVCACGRVFEAGGGLQLNGRIQLASWQEFRVRHIIDAVLQWPTVGSMADSVSKMVPSARLLLERALLAGEELLDLTGEPAEVSQASRYLAAEGWLVPVGLIGADLFRLTSPLVRSLAMRQLVKERGRELKVPLPFSSCGQLDVPTALCAALPHFRPATMRTVFAYSSKTSTAPVATFVLPTSKQVPNEAVYHFELFAVLRQWLNLWRHAVLYPEADVLRTSKRDCGTTSELRAASKRYADMLIGPSRSSSLTHILELVASSSSAEIRAHYARAIDYMVSHHTNRGTCITFTAVASASAVLVPSSSLDWPTGLQLGTGLVAVHIVHDLQWTTAEVFWKSAAGSGESIVNLGLCT